MRKRIKSLIDIAFDNHFKVWHTDFFEIIEMDDLINECLLKIISYFQKSKDMNAKDLMNLHYQIVYSSIINMYRLEHYQLDIKEALNDLPAAANSRTKK